MRLSHENSGYGRNGLHRGAAAKALRGRGYGLSGLARANNGARDFRLQLKCVMVSLKWFAHVSRSIS